MGVTDSCWMYVGNITYDFIQPSQPQWIFLVNCHKRFVLRKRVSSIYPSRYCQETETSNNISSSYSLQQSLVGNKRLIQFPMRTSPWCHLNCLRQLLIRGYRSWRSLWLMSIQYRHPPMTKYEGGPLPMPGTETHLPFIAYLLGSRVATRRSKNYPWPQPYHLLLPESTNWTRFVLFCW